MPSIRVDATCSVSYYNGEEKGVKIEEQEVLWGHTRVRTKEEVSREIQYKHKGVSREI